MAGISPSKTSDTTEIVWMFTEAEIEELRKDDLSQTSSDLTTKSSNMAWSLSFNSKCNTGGKSYTYLHVLPQPQDLRLATSTNTWVRAGLTRWTVSLVQSESDPSLDIKQKSSSRALSANDSNWGGPLKITAKEILASYDENKFFGLRFSITSDHSLPAPSLPSRASLSIFDKIENADTVFVVHRFNQEALHIFACKAILVSTSSHFETLFKAGFAETSSQKKQDIGSFAISSDKDGLSLEAAKTELVPFVPSTSDNDVKCHPLSSSAAAKEVKSKESGNEPDQDGTGFGRRCTVIDVHESDYHTYRSMIAYLHTQVTPFFYLPSDLLVTTKKSDDISATIDNLLTKGLKRIVTAAKAHPLWYGVTPCSVHAMYRLADRYLLEELKEMSLGFITRSLTPENVSYELFSPLSLDHEKVQKPILDYFVNNWVEVKKTQSFSNVFQKFGSGELTRGKDLMFAIFDKMKP